MAGRGQRSSARGSSRQSTEKFRDAREGSPDWRANGGESEAIMFGRGVFLKGKIFHSIVILVPLHVSKFYRVVKKLIASSGGSDAIKHRKTLPMSLGTTAQNARNRDRQPEFESPNIIWTCHARPWGRRTFD
jgi:hypothetical protein